MAADVLLQGHWQVAVGHKLGHPLNLQATTHAVTQASLEQHCARHCLTPQWYEVLKGMVSMIFRMSQYLRCRCKVCCVHTVVYLARLPLHGVSGNILLLRSSTEKNTELYSAVHYSTVQYSTVQYSTVQYSTVQYSTVQCSTVQYSAVQPC